MTTAAVITSSDIFTADPKLSALASNGGPTQTMAIASDGSACNAGLSSFTGVTIPTVDQRGVSRTAYGKVDIGAYELAVVPPKVTSVSINGASSIPISKMTQYTATVQPSGASSEVRWGTYDTNIIKVNAATGQVLGVRTGTATLIAKAQDGSNKVTSKTITVCPLATSVAINGASSITIGKMAQYTATVQPSGAINEATWGTYDTNIIKVNAGTGQVLGIRTGTATLIAKAQDGSNKVTSKTITVVASNGAALGGISATGVTINGASSITIGVMAQYTATVQPSGASSAVRWGTYDTNIIKVNAGTGQVLGIRTGTATLIAKAQDGSNKVTSKKITVVASGTVTSSRATALQSAASFTLPSGTNARTETAATALTANDAAIQKAIASDKLQAIGGQLYLKDEIVQNAAKASGTGYSNIFTLPIFKITDAGIKSGDTAAAEFEISGDKFSADTISADKVQVLKVFPDGTGKFFAYAKDLTKAEDKTYAILDENNNIATEIEPQETYKLVLFVSDNGSIDLDKVDEGIIIDPAAILTVGTSNKASSGSDSGSSSGGCNAGFASLALLALIPLAWRRKK
jgi:Synergist-CTERM protein sorting domain-containing protein